MILHIKMILNYFKITLKYISHIFNIMIFLYYTIFYTCDMLFWMWKKETMDYLLIIIIIALSKCMYKTIKIKWTLLTN